MKTLTKEEFESRSIAVAEARKIFIPHFTKSITLAFEIYNEMLTEEKHQLQLTKERNRDYGILAGLQRPLCLNCGKEMALRLINIPQGRENVNGYKTSWICEDRECYHEEYSTNTLQDWLKELKQKEAV